MTRGFDKHQARLQAIQLLGKDLARRARSRCEWCEERETLNIYDTTPKEEPSLDAVMLLCARCRALADGEVPAALRTLRFLEGAVWNETPVVAERAQAALRLVDTAWARNTLEMFGE